MMKKPYVRVEVDVAVPVSCEVKCIDLEDGKLLVPFVSGLLTHPDDDELGPLETRAAMATVFIAHLLACAFCQTQFHLTSATHAVFKRRPDLRGHTLPFIDLRWKLDHLDSRNLAVELDELHGRLSRQ